MQNFFNQKIRSLWFFVPGIQAALLRQVDLDSGTILVGPELEDVAQHVALAFSASLLYLMVQPRPAVVDESIKDDAGTISQLQFQCQRLKLLDTANVITLTAIAPMSSSLA